MATGFYRFLKLYRTPLLGPETARVIILDPVRVEIFDKSRTYQILAQTGPTVIPAGKDAKLLEPRVLSVPDERSHIEFIARVKKPVGAREFCENQIDRAVATLAAVLTPDLFINELWRGWIADSTNLFGDAWIKTVPPIDEINESVIKRAERFRSTIASNSDLDRRFTLMSKLFTRAISMRPGEEKFLWLWTALEVYPMKGTSNIGPISELLSDITGKPAAGLKSKLQIGQLFGARSDLVHDGRLPIAVNDFGSVLSRLEAIALVALRHAGGMPYDGSLDQFL